MKNSDMPAMPMTKELADRYIDTYADGDIMDTVGLTKREELSKCLMVAYRASDKVIGTSSVKVAAWAVEDADALLAELEK
jgi:hypothetical protein